MSKVNVAASTSGQIFLLILGGLLFRRQKLTTLKLKCHMFSKFSPTFVTYNLNFSKKWSQEDDFVS